MADGHHFIVIDIPLSLSHVAGAESLVASLLSVWWAAYRHGNITIVFTKISTNVSSSYLFISTLYTFPKDNYRR